MALFNAADDWLRWDDLGSEFSSAITAGAVTIALWARPGAQTAFVPYLLEFAGTAGAGPPYFAIIYVSGLWYYAYDDGAGNASAQAIAFADADEWRFLSLTIHEKGGLWEITSRVRLAGDPVFNAWETNLTYATEPAADLSSAREHTISTPQAAVLAQYVGHVQHVKVWSGKLSDDELWRESQRGMPYRVDDLVAWNILTAADASGIDTWYAQAGLLAAGGAYGFDSSPPQWDAEMAPITVRPKQTDPMQVQTRTGLLACLCGGTLALQGFDLLPQVGAYAELDQGVMLLQGIDLVPVVGLYAELDQGVVLLQGIDLVPVIGTYAELDQGVVLLQGIDLVPVVGTYVELDFGELLLQGIDLLPATGEVLETGTLALVGIDLAPVVGTYVELDFGELLLVGAEITPVVGLYAELDFGVMLLQGFEVLPDAPPPVTVAMGLAVTIEDEVLSVELDDTVGVVVADEDLAAAVEESYDVAVADEDLRVELDEDLDVTLE